MAKLLFLNGPNLNLLGQREPHHYGRDSLASIEAHLKQLAPKHQLNFFQSNHEGALVDQIQQAKDRYDFILINPGAFGHTSIAIRDAFLAVEIPFIELHLSNIFAREDFRRQTFLSDIAAGIIIGFGAKGYELALLAALDFLTKNQ